VNEETLVIIPTYNEAENIEEVVRATLKHEPHAHILVVDDNSKDQTQNIVRSLQKDLPGTLHMITRAGKLGLGTAYIAGFKWALARSYQTIIEMDADLSHDPAVVPQMLQTFKQGADVVIGSRYVPGGGTVNWGLGRKLISRFGSLYARTILGLRIRDLTGGYNAWSRRVLEKISLDQVKSEGYSFQIELKYRAHKAGFTLKEIPITFADRRAGQSKMSGKIVLEAMIRVWKLRFYP
jgi:dolichol-phosphate mannosyltransferase